jgi:membrane protein DedA with SNARE-associated domain
LLHWLLSVPAWLAYLAVFVATVLENVFPPTPSDVIVALGGFLSQHSITQPALVFLCAWSGGVLAAGALYAVARRHGRRFFTGQLGRGLLPPDAVAAMEREYLRLGPVGLFLARLIPGVRTFVAPFGGLVDLPPGRVMVPIALASALWYAGLTWVGVALGEEWDTIVRFIGRLNVGMAIFGVLVVVAFVGWRLAARRRSRRAELLAALHAVLLEESPEQASLIRAGAATLLAEIARADATLGRAQLADIETCLREHWTAELPVVPGSIRLPNPRSTDEVAAIVADQYGAEARAAAMNRLREVLRADSRLTPHQQQLLSRAAELLGVSVEGP